MVEEVQIEPNKFYTMGGLLELNVMPFTRSVVIKHIENGNLVASTFGEERGTRYLIKGSNVIEFLVKLEDGTL